MIPVDLYNACCGWLRRDLLPASTIILGSLDIVLKVERDLVLFKVNVPSSLEWVSDGLARYSSLDLDKAIAQQRNVLYAGCVADRYNFSCYFPNSLYMYIHLQLPSLLPYIRSTILQARLIMRTRTAEQLIFRSVEMQSTVYSSRLSKYPEACETAAH